MTKEELKELWQARPEYLNEDQEGHEDFNKGWNACMEEWGKIILDAPTTDAEHRHWIDINGDGSLWKCSVCGETQCCNSNYCGDCGAKMDEVEG